MLHIHLTGSNITIQQRIFTETVEANLTARVNELFAIITDTITNGLSAMIGRCNYKKWQHL